MSSYATGIYSLEAAADVSITMNKVAAANPCAIQKPHADNNPCAKNPCSTDTKSIDAKLVTRPKGTQLLSDMPKAQLVTFGAALFKDDALSTNGLSCYSCHETPALFNASFTKPYPHQVSMAEERAGIKNIHADEFVQFCLVAPMQSQPLPWESKELAALTVYVTDVKQQEFIRLAQSNPCFLKKNTQAQNPCAGQNPCAAKNPGGNKNPCTAKNPCAVNPCMAKRSKVLA